ncbi:MAG: (2Fe-2S)-binding protein [Gudongella sp.]|nr:(2Fe-2S)-binding protein [Gudongella sp.]
MEIKFTLNGEQVTIIDEPTRRLLDVLRDNLGLTGAKEGCGEGECGSCAVLMDGRLVNSCMVPAFTVEDRDILTIEGFRDQERFKAISRGFEKAGSVQCGFCTPGFVMAAEALLRQNPHPTEEEIIAAIEGNLCRCTGYSMIVEGIMIASREGDGLW